MATSKVEEDITWQYEFINQFIKSPEFRCPIKDFVDENCESFVGEQENTFHQGALHNVTNK